ncbi:4-hydroxyphenylacetate 3-monooxygenase, oxygenase component [Halobacillus litoralis]|uniref:4-hydroxyphenylacetate 3-monooxygenase, oxygenase component n=1 Tax=Halobacillus litoralis TaxID=45668 RepID=A0A410MGE7_9BACI|nr:4-hydroxyphenylacetate 3-monooxygenase, oxygenase component [Halobacillus litoralis]QAS53791.1 4-hydroxyphenylacetate 3-monooxygenase, oxygenase component [Halobacillus litoralis]
MPVITGEDYKKRIDAMESEVWFDGAKVTGKISDHPAFKGVVGTQSQLYDMQNESKIKNEMTFASETTGNDIGVSYLIPRTRADLEKRRIMIQHWARISGGLMGRSPDYMNTVLASFASSVDVLDGEDNCYPDRLLHFYEYAREKDLSFTHTFVNPQSNRSKLAFLEEDVTNARIIDRNEEGLIIKGAKLLATQGGITDEILVFSAPGAQESCHAYGFSLPTDTDGLKFVCRESFATKDSSFDYPLSSRFAEMDTIVIFDGVLVPWNRVFFHDNIRAATQMYLKGKFVPFTLHQIVSRQIVKTEFLLGIAQSIVDTINISDYQHVQSKVVEIVKGLETLRALLLMSEHDAKIDGYGVMVPSKQPLYVAVNQFQELYPRFTEIIQLLGASGLMTIPKETDFDTEIGEQLDHFLQGVEVKGKDRVALFRLAWDLTMSGFGSRQTLYERFFFGDPVRLSQTIYQNFDETKSKKMIEDFLSLKE